MGLKIKLVPGDVPVEKGPAVAQTVTQKFVSDKNMVAVVGPSTSGAVAATSKTLTQAGLVQVSPSATRTTLTKGDNQEATNAFFRVVPADDFQGPTDAELHDQHAARQERRDLRLPGALLAGPRRRGREGAQGRRRDDVAPVGRRTRSRTSRPYVTKVPSDADIVFFPTQPPAAAQAFASSSPSRARRRRSSAATARTVPA